MPSSAAQKPSPGVSELRSVSPQESDPGTGMTSAATVRRSEAGMISVQTVVQVADGTPPWPLLRQEHRVPDGTSIRELLCRGGLAQVVARIDSGALGLARHGKRAWLDDILQDGWRVEVTEPINVDAKAQRTQRVAVDRARRRFRPATAG